MTASKAAIFGAERATREESSCGLAARPSKREPVARHLCGPQAGEAVASGPPAPLAPDRPDVRLRAAAGADEPEVIFLAGAHGVRLRGRAGAARHRDPGRGPLGRLPPEGSRSPSRSSTARRRPPSRGAAKFVYGLPELFREQIASSRAVASPGCFRHGLDPRARAAVEEWASSRRPRPIVGLRHHRLLGRRRASAPRTTPPSTRRAAAFFALRHRRAPAPPGDRGVAFGGWVSPPPGGSSLQTHSRRSGARHLRDRDACRSSRGDGPARRLMDSTGRRTCSEFFIRLVEGSPTCAAGQGDEFRRHRRRGAGDRRARLRRDRQPREGSGRARRSRPMNIMFGLPEPTGLKMTGVFPMRRSRSPRRSFRRTRAGR